MTKLMQTDLLNTPFFVGLKQSTDAIKNGKAAKAFVANRRPCSPAVCGAVQRAWGSGGVL